MGAVPHPSSNSCIGMGEEQEGLKFCSSRSRSEACGVATNHTQLLGPPIRTESDRLHSAKQVCRQQTRRNRVRFDSGGRDSDYNFGIVVLAEARGADVNPRLQFPRGWDTGTRGK